METSTQHDVPSIIRKANIIYDSAEFQTGYPHVPLLVSNGIVGGCFDHMGFQSRPNSGIPEGRTVLGYIDHYDLGVKNSHQQFPLAIINAKFQDGTTLLNLMDAKNYKQELDLYTGTLNTKYNLFGEMDITAFAHQTIPNLFIMNINRQPEVKGKQLRLSIDCETSKESNNDMGFNVDPTRMEFSVEKDQVKITSSTDITVTNWIIHCPGASFDIDGDNININLANGQNTLKIWIERDDSPGQEVLNKTYEELLASHVDEWQSIWEKSWVDIPEERGHNIWTRMKYYAVSHFPVITEKPMIPTGLNSNIWGFTFPQDVYYVAENLPRIGHFDRSEKALQYWLNILPDVETYCERIMGVEGAFYPWEMPFQDFDRFETDGVKGPNSYELHDQAYVVAMVYHYYQIRKDTAFLTRYFPIIEESSRFYANLSSINDQGSYDIYHENARGQDEASTTEGKLKNLLCASYSAEYTFRAYLATAPLIQNPDKDLLEKAKDIALKGYDKSNLITGKGYYTTYENDHRPPNSQKHPVQLNPIAYLPMPDHVEKNSPVDLAWQDRYSLTIDAHKPITQGWTAGEFALASARMKDPAAFAKDLGTLQICRGADPRWIQFYESSFWTGWHLMKSYYFPMHGLYLQSFTDCLVQDWRGYTDVFGCLLPAWKSERIAFHGIHTKDGISVDGEWNNGDAKVTLYPVNNTKASFMLSQDMKLVAKGQKSGPISFSGFELVEFEFNENQPITIKSIK